MKPILKIARLVQFGDPFLHLNQYVFPVVEEQYRFIVEIDQFAFDLERKILCPILNNTDMDFNIVPNSYYAVEITPVIVDTSDIIESEWKQFGEKILEQSLPKIMEYQELFKKRKLISFNEYQLTKKHKF